MRLVFAALVTGTIMAVLAAACSADESAAPNVVGGQGGDALDGTWILSNGTHGGQALPMPAGATIDLTIDGSTAGGTAACNSWFGEVATGDRSMSFSGLGQTEMGCEPDRMAAESAFLQALGDVAAWEIVDGTLTLTGPGLELTFDRQAPIADAELTGTKWVLDTVIEGETASSTVGDEATLLFGGDGVLAGSTGCRSFTGRWETDAGGQLVISEVTSDDRACPAALSRQDQNVLETLFGRVTAEVDGTRLTIMGPQSTGLGYAAG